MKKTTKTTGSKSYPAKTMRMTVTDYLRNLSETFNSVDRRFYTRREAVDFVRALRSALADPTHLLVQDSLTQECYRYLTLVNRTPVSGLSLITCLGANLARQVSLSSRLQMMAGEYADRLRKGTIKPDDEVPEYALDLYLEYVELLSRCLCHFDVNIEQLESAITSNSTFGSLENFIFDQFDANTDVPESFIEAFVLAHAYLYRLSLLD